MTSLSIEMKDVSILQNIILVFYFAYWLIYNSTPFSSWILIFIYMVGFIWLAFVAGVINKSVYTIQEESTNIQTTIKGFEKRLKYLEKEVIK